MEKKTKKVTIDDLAIMMAKSFERVDKRFDEVDKRFNEVDKRFEKVDENIRNIRGDILNLGDRFVSYHTFDSLANRVKILEEKKK